MKSLRERMRPVAGRRKLTDRIVLRILRRRVRLDLRIIPGLLGCEPSLVLEIGSHHGEDAVRMRSTFPSASIHCFEPDPRALAQWKSRPPLPDVTLHEIAIGSHDGTADFHQSSGVPSGEHVAFDEGWDASGSIRAPRLHLTEHPWCTFPSTITVPMRSLDSWAAEHGVEQVDFIWADVQGAEIDLVEGGQRTLANTRLLYTEINDIEMYEGQITLEGLLARLPGWSVVKRYPNDVLLRNDRLRRR
jgi:FkbM family methyltransferase